MSTPRLDCPSCGAKIVSAPRDETLRCMGCGWKLLSRAEWLELPPARQGYILYMQGAWPTSELARERNPYAEGTVAHAAFAEGEQRAALDTQDGEE